MSKTIYNVLGLRQYLWIQVVIPYRTKFRRTKFSLDKIFRRTKFSTPSPNFDNFVRFLPDFCIEILDKIFDGQNISSNKIFDTKPKFRQFCPIFAWLLYWNSGQNFRRTKFSTPSRNFDKFVRRIFVRKGMCLSHRKTSLRPTKVRRTPL